MNKIIHRGIKIQLSPSNLGSTSSLYIELQLSILINPFHSVVFTMLQSERNFFLEKGLIGELVVWHLQWPKIKGHTKDYTTQKTKDWTTWTTLTFRDELSCFRRIGISCSIIRTHRVTLKRHEHHVVWKSRWTRSGQTKTIKLVFDASPLSTQQKRERSKTGWLGIRIMCLSGATCQSADFCFSGLAL